ncbi:hypothetical protein ACFVFT_38575 [Streptomyces tendae]|uniref:hypothetical protein n=1 Tax=Streptomyces tendae TaxID=1932 RepID=UPI003698B9D0
MSVAPVEAVLKPWWELARHYGEPRTVLHYACRTAVPREQHEAYAFNIAGGKVLRESGVRVTGGKTWALVIRVVKYIEPVKLRTRYALDFWAGEKWRTADHDALVVIEALYEAVVHAEALRPTITAPAQRVGHGPATYYDVTDVI